MDESMVILDAFTACSQPPMLVRAPRRVLESQTHGMACTPVAAPFTADAHPGDLRSRMFIVFCVQGVFWFHADPSSMQRMPCVHSLQPGSMPWLVEVVPDSNTGSFTVFSVLYSPLEKTHASLAAKLACAQQFLVPCISSPPFYVWRTVPDPQGTALLLNDGIHERIFVLHDRVRIIVGLRASQSIVCLYVRVSRNMPLHPWKFINRKDFECFPPSAPLKQACVAIVERDTRNGRWKWITWHSDSKTVYVFLLYYTSCCIFYFLFISKTIYIYIKDLRATWPKVCVATGPTARPRSSPK